jgi:hypothetical protein
MYLNKHENNCVHIVMIPVFSSLKYVKLDKRRRMHYGVGKRRAGEEGGDLSVLLSCSACSLYTSLYGAMTACRRAAYRGYFRTRCSTGLGASMCVDCV